MEEQNIPIPNDKPESDSIGKTLVKIFVRIIIGGVCLAVIGFFICLIVISASSC